MTRSTIERGDEIDGRENAGLENIGPSHTHTHNV